MWLCNVDEMAWRSKNTAKADWQMVPSGFKFVFLFFRANLISIFALNIRPPGNRESERKKGRERERKTYDFLRGSGKNFYTTKKRKSSQDKGEEGKKRWKRGLPLIQPLFHSSSCPISSSKHSHLCRASCKVSEKVREPCPT